MMYSVPGSVAKIASLLKTEAYLAKSWGRYNEYCNVIKTEYKGKKISGIHKTRKTWQKQ